MENEKLLSLINHYNVKRVVFDNDPNNDRYINQVIHHIYIINLETDIIRRKYVTRLMEKMKINFEFIIVSRLSEEDYNIIGNKKITLGEAGCYMSHMFCLNDAIINNYGKIIIFEDDIIIHQNFHELFEETMKADDYDILMLGASDFHFCNFNYNRVDKIKNRYKPSKATKFLCGTYGILYSNKGIKEVFDTRLESPTFMDDNLIYFLNIFKETFYVRYPHLVAVDVSSTNIDHDFWIYNRESRDKNYYRSCFKNNFNFSDYYFINLILLKNIKIDKNKTYKENIIESIKLLFKNDDKKINTIIPRLDYNFFNTQDLAFIIDN